MYRFRAAIVRPLKSGIISRALCGAYLGQSANAYHVEGFPTASHTKCRILPMSEERCIRSATAGSNGVEKTLVCKHYLL
jgi:hypothetical protein